MLKYWRRKNDESQEKSRKSSVSDREPHDGPGLRRRAVTHLQPAKPASKYATICTINKNNHLNAWSSSFVDRSKRQIVSYLIPKFRIVYNLNTVHYFDTLFHVYNRKKIGSTWYWCSPHHNFGTEKIRCLGASYKFCSGPVAIGAAVIAKKTSMIRIKWSFAS